MSGWSKIQEKIDHATSELTALLESPFDSKQDDLRQLIDNLKKLMDEVSVLSRGKSTEVWNGLAASTKVLQLIDLDKIKVLKTSDDCEVKEECPNARESHQMPNNSKASPKKDEHELDSFSNGRRKVIEGTIVLDNSSLPLLSSIAGMDEAKQVFLEALEDPLKYPTWFENMNLKPWKTVLLFGPPGTGKTALVRSVVRHLDGTLYQVSSSDIISSWTGQSEKLIRELFDHALSSSSKKQTIIFIDEVDSLCRKRSSRDDDFSRRLKTEFLVQVERLQTSSTVILVSATNCPWELDPAFLRRFEKKIYIGLPCKNARLLLLKLWLSAIPFDCDVSFDQLADLTNGFSGDDIRKFSSELGFSQFRKFKLSRSNHLSAPSSTLLKHEDVMSVLQNFRTSIDATQLSKFEEYLTR